ncbi:acyl carrier protein [Streptomyces sp. 351MFTsu5.1]|uniref:acyl carrier protein n=1 Tax=Streptomyces sp. 351MFTsu5.1 TaxID=1172180 RepID=UPI00037AD713|nr:acyl carrier protein [Streptomyces sp. 351MFTsu5.1]
MDAIADRIVNILVEKFAVEDDITPATAFSGLELDSLVMLELSVIIERDHGLRIPEDELLEAGSVDGIVALITAGSRAA